MSDLIMHSESLIHERRRRGSNRLHRTAPPTRQAMVRRQSWTDIGIAYKDTGLTVKDVVQGSPADQSGFEVGWVLRAVASTPVWSAEDIRRADARLGAEFATTFACPAVDRLQDTSMDMNAAAGHPLV